MPRLREEKTIVMFKNGDKQEVSKYSGINLLDTAHKLMTKYITNKLLLHSQMNIGVSSLEVNDIFLLRPILVQPPKHKPALMEI